MDKGTKKYRNMMKNMERGGMVTDVPNVMRPKPSIMRPDTIEQTTADLPQDPNLKDLTLPPIAMSKLMEMLKDVPQEIITEGIEEGAKIPSGTVVREGEIMGGMSMEDRQAIEALTTMGISLEDAIEAVMGTVPESMVEGAALGATMGGGALGALPMQRPTTRPDEFGADRTQSMDMQKEGMGT